MHQLHVLTWLQTAYQSLSAGEYEGYQTQTHVNDVAALHRKCITWHVNNDGIYYITVLKASTFLQVQKLDNLSSDKNSSFQ